MFLTHFTFEPWHLSRHYDIHGQSELLSAFVQNMAELPSVTVISHGTKQMKYNLKIDETLLIIVFVLCWQL